MADLARPVMQYDSPMTDPARPVMQFEYVSEDLVQAFGDAGLVVDYDQVQDPDISMLSSYDPSSSCLDPYLSLMSDPTFDLDQLELLPGHSDYSTPAEDQDYEPMAVDHLELLPGHPDYSTPAEDQDFEPMEVDHTGLTFTEEEEAASDEFVKMIMDQMDDELSSGDLSTSEPMVDVKTGPDASSVSVGVQPPSPTPSTPTSTPEVPEDDKHWPTVNPFTEEICKANVTYCFDKAPSEELDSLDFFAMEYVRAVRFLKVKVRWHKLPIRCWMREMDLLSKAVVNPGSKVKLWPPLHRALVTYHATVGDIAKRRLVMFKRMFLRQMMEEGKLLMQANKEAVDELLTALKLKLHRSSCVIVRKEVDEHCAERGSLLVSSLPEFQNLYPAMSSKWFWVD